MKVRIFKMLLEIGVERERQDGKWGEQNHSPELWLPILIEEVGEVARAMYEKDGESYREELIHVAAVACAMAECFDRKAEENSTDAIDTIDKNTLSNV